MENYVCPKGKSGRIDKILSDSFPEVSRSLIKKAIEEGRVLTIGKERLLPKSKIEEGDRFLVDLSRPDAASHLPYEFPLDIIFEDESIIVINKQSGMVTHPGDGTGGDTLVHALLHHLTDCCPVGAPDRPGIVHRLDKDTSGAIVIAKTEKAYHHLVAQFTERKVSKKYLALIHGNIKGEKGVFDSSIGRHPKVRVKMCVSSTGKKALTEWYIYKRFPPYFSLVCCKILTGRTHQIRVHFSDAHHPLVGDSTYGGKKTVDSYSFDRVMLHARELSLIHPVTNQRMTWEAAIPHDFSKKIDDIEAR